MTFEEATIQLRKARVNWRSNSGSTSEFNRVEGEIFNAFRKSNLDWETRWPEVQLKAHLTNG